MRRYLLYYLSAVFVFCTFLLGGVIWMGHADQQNETPFEQEITVLSTIPQDQATLVSSAYQRLYHIKVNVIHLTEDELLTKLESAQSEPQADVLLAPSPTLEKAVRTKTLAPIYTENTGHVPSQLKNRDGLWVGIWYDPIVIGLNRDFMTKLSPVPQDWEDIVRPQELRVVMTDFLMADASAHFLFTLITKQGKKAAYTWLKNLHPNIVSYAKALSTPSSMIGIGEADAAITLQSEAIRYIHDGFPIAIVHPKKGTAYCLTGCAVFDGSHSKDVAIEFQRWLLTEEAQMILQEQNFFFVPTNPSLPSYNAFTYKSKVLWDTDPFLTKEEKYHLIDTWVQEIRLAK